MDTCASSNLRVTRSDLDISKGRYLRTGDTWAASRLDPDTCVVRTRVRILYAGVWTSAAGDQRTDGHVSHRRGDHMEGASYLNAIVLPLRPTAISPRRMEPGGSRSGGGGGGGRGRGGEEEVNKGIMDERVLILVFQRLNWDPKVVSVAAQVSRRLRAVVNRVLWREVCISRGPRMVATLTNGAPPGQARVNGGWNSLAKILFYFSGGSDSRHFPLPQPLPGHFAGVSRFSKTSGLSFLSRRCTGDLLYVSDPCEHVLQGAAPGEDLGSYRGVFRGFIRSKTRAFLIGRQVELEQRVRCPYCGARVWSMTAARLVPRTAARRLGAHHGRLEYFVCVNGHLHGNCWLAHLSDDDDNHDDDDDDDEDDDDDDDE